VTLSGEPVVWITVGAGPYTPQIRADRISQRLHAAVRDRGVQDPAVTITEADGSSELRTGTHLLMVVTARDARSLGVSRANLAQQYASAFEAAIRADRDRYAPRTLIRSGIIGLAATGVFVGVAWVIFGIARRIRAVIDDRRARLTASLGVTEAEMSRERVGRSIDLTVRAIRAVLLVLAFNAYLTFVLGLFPWTRAASLALLSYAIAPLRAAARAFAGYLPNLLFLVVIVFIFFGSIRLVHLYFNRIRDGRVVFENFPAEWADTTNTIVRVLLIAFGAVVAFPYLPASNSPAFTGVSVFMGVLISLASSSALSNMIAGIVLTYTGAFRLGDRVKVGDCFGDIVSTSLLATHVRTIKNEDVTLPNSLGLGSSVVNYSRAAKSLGLILHTSVTIGYDAPWRQIHELLKSAALATPGILRDPAPFVWQTALNDFYVTYEINAYTDNPQEMAAIYAELHTRIQDTFFAAGVEIMSPHFTSIRDGNTIAIPAASRAKDYDAPPFRVESSAR
jgi:small-conductance mechanosensitive channel